MKTDDELNHLVATRLMHWKLKEGVYINSQLETKYTVSEYQPLSNPSQFAELAAKMQARDYQWEVQEPKVVGEMYKVTFTKYGESFIGTEKTMCRAGTIAALKAYNQIS